MKGAIMQPYFFPYIGYYQLVYHVDKFIFLDDVTFIKQGYINRNTIISKGETERFSIPVRKISSNRKINEHTYTGEFSQFIKKIYLAYKSAPFYKEISELINEILSINCENVAKKNSATIEYVFNYLGIKKEIEFSSGIDSNPIYKGEERIIDICRKNGILNYTNSIGGLHLYNKENFKNAGITLDFIKTKITKYNQASPQFIPNTSIIDILMNCQKEEVIQILESYSLVEN